jgi:hypothetical protein
MQIKDKPEITEAAVSTMHTLETGKVNVKLSQGLTN